jgi:hypothetical protein
MTADKHPDDETLGRFVLGRLDRQTMARVEGHFQGCSRCGQVAMRVPDDWLVRLLRASSPVFVTESPVDDSAGLPSPEVLGRFRTASGGSSSGKLGALVVLACLTAVFGSSVSGCSRGVGNTDLSPEAQAKAKENFRKRFEDSGKQTKDRKKSR